MLSACPILVSASRTWPIGFSTSVILFLVTSSSALFRFRRAVSRYVSTCFIACASPVAACAVPVAKKGRFRISSPATSIGQSLRVISIPPAHSARLLGGVRRTRLAQRRSYPNTCLLRRRQPALPRVCGGQEGLSSLGSLGVIFQSPSAASARAR